MAIEANNIDLQLEGLTLMMSMELDEKTGLSKIRNKICIEGEEFHFINEFDSSDELQQDIDWYRMNNKLVHCLRLNDKHQLYVSR
jgi:hypothetical protein